MGYFLRTLTLCARQYPADFLHSNILTSCRERHYLKNRAELLPAGGIDELYGCLLTIAIGRKKSCNKENIINVNNYHKRNYMRIGDIFKDISRVYNNKEQVLLDETRDNVCYIYCLHEGQAS